MSIPATGSPASASSAAARPLDYPNEWPPGSGRFGPNPRQALAHELAPHVDEVLYGGARGGGKTDWALAEGLRRCLAIEGFDAVFFRRTYRELSGRGGAIPRLLARIPRNVGRWNGTERRWTFYNGSTLSLSYLEKLSDVQAWLGLELQLMLFDQVEQIEEQTYVLVRTSLRASGDVARRLTEAGLRPSSLATANPGGVGHMWVKRRFIDPFPLGGTCFRAAPSEAEPQPMVRVFVPAKLDDNPALDQGDPSYRAKLQALPADDRAAQLEGDWNVYKGARFGLFRTAVHVRPSDQIRSLLPPPGTVARGVGVDYGSDNPFVALWGARLSDDLILVYREVWARGLTPSEQARRILESEAPGERDFPLPVALDPSCWAAAPEAPHRRTGAGKAIRPTSGPPRQSIAWHYRQAGVPVRKADNRRLEGWADIAGRLKVRHTDKLPRLLILDCCPMLIETLPALQRDPRRPEDVLKSEHDHWADALRYLVGLLGHLAPLGASPPPEGTPPTGGRRRPGVARTRSSPTGAVVPEGVTTRGLSRRGF